MCIVKSSSILFILPAKRTRRLTRNQRSRRWNADGVREEQEQQQEEEEQQQEQQNTAGEEAKTQEQEQQQDTAGEEAKTQQQEQQQDREERPEQERLLAGRGRGGP